MGAFEDKFIGFVDILGFKDMVQSAETGTGRSLEDIRILLSKLGNETDRTAVSDYGPTICPESRHIARDLKFEITQVSDCVIVSAEVSPAGVINLLQHCNAAAIRLLLEGVLVRGFVTRGSIFHSGQEFLGSGYQKALEGEKAVTAFKREASERGTPFIEIDPEVSAFVQNETDACVREMFDRYVRKEQGITALFPFKRFSHSFAIGGYGVPAFNPAVEKENNEKMRQNLLLLKERVVKFVDTNNAGAVQKTGHYLAALEAQLALCDHTDQFIDQLAGSTRLTQ